MEKYIRASAKQLEYINSLCAQLGIINPTLYDKTNMEKAGQLITRYRKQIAKLRQVDQQQILNLD